MKPHGRDCPDRCSQCLNVPVRRVEQSADVILVDGEPTRAITTPQDDYFYGRKGRR